MFTVRVYELAYYDPFLLRCDGSQCRSPASHLQNDRLNDYGSKIVASCDYMFGRFTPTFGLQDADYDGG